jgi:hypothetical protein
VNDNSVSIGSVGRDLNAPVVSGRKNIVNSNVGNFRNSDIQLLKEVLESIAAVNTEINATLRERIQKNRLQDIIEGEPMLKKRLLAAVKAGGTELAKSVANNSAISVSLEVIRGWIEAT